MSIWGVGNMERDDALNVLDGWCISIIDEIRKTFNQDRLTTLYGDAGESRIIGNIDILITLISHYRTYPNLSLEEIDKWHEDYLDTFDRTIGLYNPEPGFVTWRREFIIKTFDRLHNEMQPYNMA